MTTPSTGALSLSADLAELFQKSARLEGFKFLGLSDLTWGIEAKPASTHSSVQEPLPLVFQNDPFAELARQQGQIKTVVIPVGAEAHLFEKGPDSTLGLQWVNQVWHVQVQEKATLEMVLFQDTAEFAKEAVQAFHRIYFSLAKDATLNLTLVQQGSEKGQVRCHVDCVGEGASAQIHGLTVGRKSQRQDLWVDVHHTVPHTQSHLTAFAVVQDQAHSIFNGQLNIEPGAFFTEAFQKNKNLILSDRASVDTFPKLLIANSEVKCGHGSTVSSLDPEQLMYLQSRGIDQAEAQQMVRTGFMKQAIDWIKNTETREAVELALGLRIEGGDVNDF